MDGAGRARGLGIGRRLLARLEQEAADRNISTLRLETNRALVEAIAMYEHAGFRRVEAFNDEPYAHHWFEKSLSRDASSRSSTPLSPVGRPRVGGTGGSP